MGNVPDLPQNKKPVHLHFYPKTFKFGKQKSLAMSVQVEAQHFCSKSAGQNKSSYKYHGGIKGSQRPHFTFSKSKKNLEILNISKGQDKKDINEYNLPR
jgi:hypothetical protein